MAERRDLLFQGLRVILHPFVHFCVRHNIRLQEFEEVAKLAFLDVAEQELQAKGESISQSRLSVITGLHRRDVNRLYVQEAEPKLSHNLLTRVIGQWRSDRRYCTAKGKPRTLGVDGRESEFTLLVWSISRDANPYAVLFELERTGLVQRTANGVELLSAGFVPRGDFEQGFSLLSRDVSDLLSAVESNVVEGAAPLNLHLSTEFDNLPLSKAKEVKQWFLEEGAALHRKVQKFLAKLDRDLAPKQKVPEKGRVRAVLGTFSRVHTLPDKLLPEEEP